MDEPAFRNLYSKFYFFNFSAMFEVGLRRLDEKTGVPPVFVLLAPPLF
jgi:hypothetical protein